MATYVLPFNAEGRIHETFQVPAGKRVYLVRAPAVSAGTATVCDLLSLANYVIPDGVTVHPTNIPEGANVSLAFMARSAPDITFVNAEVIRPREDETPQPENCKSD